jgi:hypothetical protein
MAGFGRRRLLPGSAASIDWPRTGRIFDGEGDSDWETGRSCVHCRQGIATSADFIGFLIHLTTPKQLKNSSTRTPPVYFRITAYLERDIKTSKHAGVRRRIATK